MSLNPTRFRLMPSGFHGDLNLIKITDLALSHSSHFVETGTNVGSTLRHVAQRFPNVSCLSCEPDSSALAHARNATAALTNVTLRGEKSETFLPALLNEELSNISSDVTYWLDAHSYGWGWPLAEELQSIGSSHHPAWVFIDDCEVPDRPEFAYHADGQERCTVELISETVLKQDFVEVWGPDYHEHTSNFHPLTGWCLVRFVRSTDNSYDLESLLGPGLIRRYA